MGIKAALSQTTAKDHLTGQAISCQHRSQVDGFFEGLEYLIMKTQIVALHIFTNQPLLYDKQERPKDPSPCLEVFIMINKSTGNKFKRKAYMPYSTDRIGNFYIEKIDNNSGKSIFTPITKKEKEKLAENFRSNLTWNQIASMPVWEKGSKTPCE
jgi:hypothetical protein